MSYERSPRALCSMTIGTRGMWLSFRQLSGCHADDSNQVVVKGGDVRREIEIDAGIDEVWDALASEEGRASWLDEEERSILVESAEPPHRLVWWWWEDDGPATRVEFLVVPAVSRTRVVVTESSPGSVPLASLCARFALVAAGAPTPWALCSAPSPTRRAAGWSRPSCATDRRRFRPS